MKRRIYGFGTIEVRIEAPVYIKFFKYLGLRKIFKEIKKIMSDPFLNWKERRDKVLELIKMKSGSKREHNILTKGPGGKIKKYKITDLGDEIKSV